MDPLLGVIAGADAMVSKSSSTRALLVAIREVAHGPRTPPAISREMLVDAAANLDPADHAILAMRVAGDSSADIGDVLGLPPPETAKRIAAIATTLANAEPAAANDRGESAASRKAA